MEVTFGELPRYEDYAALLEQARASITVLEAAMSESVAALKDRHARMAAMGDRIAVLEKALGNLSDQIMKNSDHSDDGVDSKCPICESLFETFNVLWNCVEIDAALADKSAKPPAG